MDQEILWYTLTPGIVYQDKNVIFRPQDINPVASHYFNGSQDAGVYTRSELKGFWDSLLINAAWGTALRKFSQNLFTLQSEKEQTVLIFIPHEPSSL